MGALEEGRFSAGLGNAVRPDPESELGSGSGPQSTREIEEAVRVLLEGLGEDQDREGLKKTPLRVAKAFREGTRGYNQKVKDIVQGALFPESGLDNGVGYAGGNGGLVVVRDINLFSYCESCLLPFRVQCHVGYIPSEHRVIGLSKLSRVSDVFAKRLQEPQRLADEVCLALQSSIKPAGVAVVLLCWHIQLPEALNRDPNPNHPSKLDMQGWVLAPVCSRSGVFEEKDSPFWADFSALLQLRGVDLGARFAPMVSWCPSSSLEAPHCNGHSTKKPSHATVSSMIAAVSLILGSLVEDPLRDELLGTPYRYVQWLMKFKRSSSEIKLNASSLGRKARGAGLGHGGIKIRSELNLPFCSQCEHHLLPFNGVVHVGYFDEEGGVLERSLLQSVVHFYGCKLQVQERLTRQIGEAVHSVMGRGAMVVVEANHICMVSRGIEKVGSSTATIAVMGEFSTDPVAKGLFFESISKAATSGG